MTASKATRVAIPLRIRYFEADQQGVVFNMWYMAYFEDARNAYLEAVGYPLQALLASGHDIQVVAANIAWRGPVRWGDTDVEVVTHISRVGASSLTFEFEVRRREVPLVTGQTVYVIVAADGSGKRPVPEDLRDAVVATDGSDRKREG